MSQNHRDYRGNGVGDLGRLLLDKLGSDLGGLPNETIENKPAKSKKKPVKQPKAPHFAEDLVKLKQHRQKKRDAQHRNKPKSVTVSPAQALGTIRLSARALVEEQRKVNKTKSHYERNEEALRQVKIALSDQLWTVEEPTIPVASLDQSQVLEGAWNRGASILSSTGKNDGSIVLGFDLGTSSTKLIAHDPFAAGEPSCIIDCLPLLQYQRKFGLWRTAIWVHPISGQITTWPVSGGVKISGFKGPYFMNEGHRTVSIGKLTGFTYEMAMAAFIAITLNIAIVRLSEMWPARTGQIVINSIRFGVPSVDLVSKGDLTGEKTLKPFSLGLQLAKQSRTLTVETVKEAFNSPSYCSEQPHISLGTELCGALNGYLATKDKRAGPHWLVDVGAGTVDSCTVLIEDIDITGKLHGRVATVEPLGAESWRIAHNNGVDSATFQHALYATVFETFHKTRRIDISFDRTKKPENKVSFVLVGGGRHCDLHKDYMTREVKNNYLGRPWLTPNLSRVQGADQAEDPQMFLVAFGLSRHTGDWRAISFLSRGDDPPIPGGSYTDRYIDKDQC